MRLGGLGTFDNFNMVVSGVKGTIAAGLNEVYDTLMVPASDEVSTEYGLLAEAVAYPPDFSAVTYRLRAEAQVARRQAGDARGRDLLARGIPEKPPDALGLLPPCGEGGEDRASARSPSRSTVREIANCRRSSASSTCCRSIGGRAPTRQARSATSPLTTLEPPLGSGAYRIKEFVAGRTIALRAREGLLGQGPQCEHRPR